MKVEARAAVVRDAVEAIEQAASVIPSLAGARVLVTGASGLIGSLLVVALLAANRLYGLSLSVIAVGRCREKLEDVFADELRNGEPLELLAQDVRYGLTYAGAVSHIVHGASPTSSRFFVEHPVETIEAAYRGTRNLLDFALRKEVASFVYLSSLEVYGTLANDGHYIEEAESGCLDSMSVRSSYSESKRLCETLCAAYAKEYKVPAVVARLSQTFGAGVRADDGRVFAEFARCALEGRPIILHSEGRTTRTYCSTSDAVSALIFLLVRGIAGEAYNVANETTTISISEMADLANSLLADGRLEVRKDVSTDPASLGYNPEMVVKLNSAKLRSLGWAPQLGIDEMFLRMADGFK